MSPSDSRFVIQLNRRFLFNTIGIELHFLELFDDPLQDTIKAAYTNWAEKMLVFFDSFAKKEVQVVISEEA